MNHHPALEERVFKFEYVCANEILNCLIKVFGHNTLIAYITGDKQAEFLWSNNELQLRSLALDVVEEIGGDRAFWDAYCELQLQNAVKVLRGGIADLLDENMPLATEAEG